MNQHGGVPIDRALRGVLCLLGLLGAVSAARAQTGQSYYGSGAYPPAADGAIQRTQNVYYGNYQDNRIPGYIYPRNYHVPAAQSYGGDGITYYYVGNPNGPTYTPYSSAPPQPAPRAPQGRVTTWPMPANTPPPQPRPAPVEDLGDGRKPMVQFHRPTKEKGWAKGEYLGAFVRPMPFAAPLVTTGAAGDLAPGVIGQPNTAVLFGDRDLDFGLQSGFRVGLGRFLDCDNDFSLEIVGFWVLPVRQSFSMLSDNNGSPVIARPFLNVVAGREAAFLNSLPANLAGTLSIENKIELIGGELNVRWHGYFRERVRADALVGFRYLRLAERMQIREQISSIGVNNLLVFQTNPVNAPNFLVDEDIFRTVNQFFGPQIGVRAAWEHDWINVEGFAKLGIGANRQHTTVLGSTTLVTPQATETAAGGILAQPTNIGNRSRTRFGLVPEIGFNVGVELTQHVRLNLGYSFLMWNHVVRPGGQIDRNINPTQVPGSPTFGALSGPPSPAYRFNEELFWTHMLNVGLEFHY